MFGTLIKMYIFKSYPVLSFPVAFFLVRHLFYFLCCAMCLAWHWQINFHSLNFEISSCANLTPQLQRTPALFFFVFPFSPFALFLEDVRQILHYDPRCFQLIITITSSDYYKEWMTALQQTCSAFITVHDRTRPSERKRGDYTAAVVVISRERVFLALPEHIRALSGQNYWLPDGSGSPGRAWMPFAELLTYLFTPIQLSLSQKEPLGFTVSTARCCLFFCPAHCVFNRSRGGSVNSHQVLSHSIKKKGVLATLSGLLRPLEDAIRTHQGSAHDAIPAIIFPLFKPKSHHFSAANVKRQENIISDGWRGFFCSFKGLEMNRKFASWELPLAEWSCYI